MSTSLDRLGVVGAGVMGRGIAHVALLAGMEVALVDACPAALAAAPVRFRDEFAALVRKGRITEAESEAALGRLSTSGSYIAMAEADLVIEAVPERVELKLEVLAAVADAVGEQAVIASNTSSIPITRLAQAVKGAAAVSGRALLQSGSAHATGGGHPRGRHRHPRSRHGHRLHSRSSRKIAGRYDKPGFVVNALLIGLDTLCLVADAMHVETEDPALVAPGNVRRLVEAGRLGRKSGRAFYDYPAATT